MWAFLFDQTSGSLAKSDGPVFEKHQDRYSGIPGRGLNTRSETTTIRVLILKNQKTLLYCPLDWGLGHASRGIVIIHKLQEKGYRIIIGADREPLELLRREFRELEWVRFPSLPVRYSHKVPLSVKLLFAVPKIFYGIFREHFLLKKLIRNMGVDIVISDNRYGLWNKNITTVFIIHQIGILLPGVLSLLEYPLYRLNRFFIRKYDHCWIPDLPGEKNLAGDLVHKYPLPANATFIGIISRFMVSAGKLPPAKEGAFDIVVILSGPEPQKSILEEELAARLMNCKLRTIMIMGLPSSVAEPERTGPVTRLPHLPTDKFREQLSSAKYIISRSGYTTIMDLVTLKRSAILIPTPGQTEQEYLGKKFHDMKMFVCMNQKEIDLTVGFSALERIIPPDTGGNRLLDKGIDEIG